MVKGSMYDPFVTMDVNEFGIREPISITPAGLVLDGRKRLGAAIALGYTKVPVVIDQSHEPIPKYDFKIGSLVTFRGTPLIKIQESSWCTLQLDSHQYVVGESTLTGILKQSKLKILVCEDSLTRGNQRRSKNVRTTVIQHDKLPFHQFPIGTVLRKQQGTIVYVMAQKTDSVVWLLNVSSGKLETQDANKFGIRQKVLEVNV